MSLLTEFTENRYDIVDFGLLYTAISVLSLLAENYLSGYSVGEWWLIFGVVMALFLVKNRTKKTNK
ncbi:hypothetical protein I7X12_07800 [Halosimplex litoreum]|uniref:Uncharacterized protein n=1 Tax=Halosimplex litoreum TaxID=1198301 RepID=A0A7T3G183_9EURY|nr:hypothetical protein [Halosimplex litoreum]QPV64504.1 hypothetical protein I7X12_07800 [Halosimplex litoreum]